MSSEVFESRKEDYNTIATELRRKIDTQLLHSSGEAQKKLKREIERSLEEANILIQEMESEARKAPAKFRMDMTTSVRNSRRDCDQLERDMRRATEFGQRPDVSGFYEDEEEFEDAETSQRTRLLAGSRSLTETSNSIARSHRIAAETDAIGEDIIEELGSQRESLVRTRDRLYETDSNLTKSRKILQTMSRRLMTNKLILAVIIFLEFGILGGVVYWKFFT